MDDNSHKSNSSFSSVESQDSGNSLNLNMDVCHISGLPPDRGDEYQKESLYNHYLPYSDRLDQDSDSWLQEIKTNLGKAVLLRDLRPGLVTWMSRLTGYINMHGYKFSKADHLELVRLTWHLLTAPDMEPRLMETFIRVLLCLMKKRRLLSPEDLELDWRKLYDIYEDMSGHYATMSMKIYPTDFEKSLKLLVKTCRPYFSRTATTEILNEFRPYFCPHDSMMSKAVAYCSLFLPTLFVDRDPVSGELVASSRPEWEQWREELMVFWRTCSNSPPWEGNLISLLSRLAEDNLGSICWEDTMAMMFQKIMFSLGLPVFYKKLHVMMKPSSISTNSVVRWIVYTVTPASSSLEHLETMMRAINSYFHTTSEGRYSEKLVDFFSRLVHTFCSRLHKERYQPARDTPSWVPAHPAKFNLTDDQILRFCEIVKPALLDLTMSKRYIETARQCVAVMASIRPALFLPELMARLDTALATLTSPHKFTAAAKCLGSVARILTRPGPSYPEAPGHVIDILVSVLPGIDCNDIKKTMTVFQLISIYGRLIPMVDLTAHLTSQSSLSPTEKKICNQSSKFLPFVLEFMDKCFSLVENCTMEHVRQEQSTADAHMSSEETSIHTGIVSCLHSVVHQADDAILQAVISKMEKFLKGRIMEPKVSGKIASGMLRTLASIAPGAVLPLFIPHVCSVLGACLEDTDPACDLSLGDELMFNMLLLSELLCVPGCHVVAHVGRVADTLSPLLGLHNKEGHGLAITILRHLLASLSQLCLAHRSRIVARPAAFPLHDWGRPSDLSNLDIEWFLPGQAEFDCVTLLLDRFLTPEVDKLEGFLSSDLQLDKEALHRCLKTISGIIVGCSSFLHPWEEEAIISIESQVDLKQKSHDFGLYSQFDYKFKGSNTRKMLVSLMQRMVDKILADREDDTKALNLIISILELIIFKHYVSVDAVDKHSKHFYQSKAKLEVKLYGEEKHIRTILLDRVLLHHERWMVELLHRNLTPGHRDIMRLLLRLATSHYSKVRVQAQAALARTLKQFPYSYLAIVDQVIPLLATAAEGSDPGPSHEQFKGALYIILQNQFLIKNNWRLQCRLWPAIIRARHSEKPSITALIRSVSGHIQSIDNWTISWPPLSETMVTIAQGLGGQSLRDEDISKSVAKITEAGAENRRLYAQLVDSLCDLVEAEESLHWLHYNTTLTMLCVMIRSDVPLPSRAVRIFTNNLVHDNILVRKASLHVIDCVLKQHKRKHLKIKMTELPELTRTLQENNKENLQITQYSQDNSLINGKLDGDTAVKSPRGLRCRPGERGDNKWVQYSSDNKPLDQQSYDQPRYLNKPYLGFYTWPQEDLVYAPSSQQPGLDRAVEDMPEAEQIVFRFFTDEKNISKLVEFLSLENKKGKDHFDVERFGMFKALFRNFGDSFLEQFRVHIERMVTDHRESHQRAASELLAGLIRGSKHWGYDKVSRMWAWVIPAIRRALNMVSPETMKDWGTCFATSSDSRDPNKLHWLMEMAMEEPIRSQGSFIDCSRLYMVQGVVAQQRWRVGELLQRLLTFLRPLLDHPYHNVRSRLGGVLTNIFAFDLEFEGHGNANTSSPHEDKFVRDTLPLLAPLREGEEAAEAAKDSALRLLQTLSKWVSSCSIAGVRGVQAHMFSLVPHLLGHEWYDKDPQLARDCQATLSCLSRAQHSPATVPSLVAAMEASLAAASWKTRVSCLDFLQAVIFNNFMLFCSSNVAGGSGLRSCVISLVMKCLDDVQIEVRVKAAQVLGGMIHCEFISPASYSDLVKQLRATLDHVSRDTGGAGHVVTHRHGAVLGLCAFVNAFPHTVPSIVPPLLLYLGTFLHDQQPIPATVKKTVQNWRRTHTDNWAEHAAAFTEDQLAQLTDLLVSPSYYA